ncbi:unnamed protein product [Microthlaspi erraticum]|uniref:TCP domain-containing protein n=1 Tax=Microthlaspi erraticum TaxID=1685480 RepID=A0A6D2KZ15_9BRAS|nr:unnamed protein product [Microthlaspi erraticum]
MNNNNNFGTNTTINDDYMLFPYNDHYSSQPLLPFSPSSSINDVLIHSTSNTSSNNHLGHPHQFLQSPSPFSQFDFVPDFTLLGSLGLPQNNVYDVNQTILNGHHHPPLLPLNDPVGESSQVVEPSETITHIEDSQRISASQNPTMRKGKKPSRTDRHSKIKTAKGTRDRRMRLSLDVAKELFGLQDMLGFDKASKTVEWLLTQAKPEITKIAKSLSNQFNHGGFSSGDESQTLIQGPALGSMDTSSDLCELASMWTVDNRGTAETRGDKVDGRTIKGKKKMPQPRTPNLKKVSKEARAKARERAKERTKEKMMDRSSQANVVEEESHNYHDEMTKSTKSDVNWSSFEATPCVEEIEEFCKNDRFAVCGETVIDKKDHISDQSYDMIRKMNSSFPMLNHHRSQGATSIEQQQQHQFTDLHHFPGKPRDLMYNYQNMC